MGMAGGARQPEMSSPETELNHDGDLKMQLEKARAQLSTKQEQLDELLRPLNEEMSSSRIRTELKHGESLMTGGYQLPNGNFLLFRLTPSVSEEKNPYLPEGTKGIVLKNQTLEIKAEEWAKHPELQSLQTSVKNTMQHGEAWNQNELDKLLNKLDPNSVIKQDYPSVMTSDNREVRINNVDEGTKFEMRASTLPSLLPDGLGFNMDFSHMRKEAQATAPPGDGNRK